MLLAESASLAAILTMNGI